MKFHLLQHADFEGPAAIQNWVVDNDHILNTSKLFEGDPLPSLDDFEILIVMGGPMGVDDVGLYPWLLAEREFILQCISEGKTMLGICLGAQLIARACGAKVVKNRYREIGWFEVAFDNNNLPELLTGVFPAKAEVFHWHGDTFEIPEGSCHFATSEACCNQGFILNNRVVGLQFHIETTADSAASLVHHCGNELDGSAYVQSASEMLEDSARFNKINKLLSAMLQNMTLPVAV